MNPTLTTILCYLIAVPIAIGMRILPVLTTSAGYLWALLTEPEAEPMLATVVPLPVARIPAVEPKEATPVKATKKTSTPRTTRKRTTKVAASVAAS